MSWCGPHVTTRYGPETSMLGDSQSAGYPRMQPVGAVMDANADTQLKQPRLGTYSGATVNLQLRTVQSQPSGTSAFYPKRWGDHGVPGARATHPGERMNCSPTVGPLENPSSPQYNRGAETAIKGCLRLTPNSEDD